MKIGIFTPYLEGLTGGERYMLTLASCLSLHHCVFLFWDDLTILSRAEKKFAIDLSRVKIKQNIFSPSHSMFSRLFESKKYDAIIILSDGSLPFVWSKKLFVHFQFPVPWVHGISWINKIKTHRITKVFCNSFYTKKYIDSTFEIKSEVIFPPIEIKKSNKKKENMILTVGRFGRTLEGNNYKKQDVMIEGFKVMIDQGLKDWTMTLAISVRKEDMARLNDLKKLADGYSIHFAINPSNEILWGLYNSAKIYWHASGYGEDLDQHPEYAEHFGMTTVEAMGVGVVPVVINAGGQKEIVEHGKNGFLWDNLDNLQEYTRALINDIRLMKSLSNQAEKRARVFSEKIFNNKVLELFDEKN